MVVDGGVGLSLLSWAVLGLLQEGGPPIEARFIAAALNATVGLLFLFRAPASAHGTVATTVRALPSALVLGLAWRFSPTTPWPVPSLVLTAAGALLAVTALLSLGRSFAILPARRAIVGRGPYRFVRHPAYLGEIVVAGGVGSATRWELGVALAFVTAVLCVPRILDEERLLGDDAAYTSYRETVRHRLLPGLW